MKRIIAGLSVTAAMFVAPTLASAGDWTFDQDHATVGFEVAHLGVTKVRGTFDKFSGSVEIPKGKFEKGAVNVEIETASINTRNEKRDTHLKSGDFLLAEENPKITFASKKIKKTGDNTYAITGDLTIRGKTKEVTLDATLTDAIEAWGNRRGFSGSTTINRLEWDVKWNKKFDKGVTLVGDEVEIMFDVELIEKKKESAKK